MSQNVHIQHILDAEAVIRADMDLGQIAILTDQNEEFTWYNNAGDELYYAAAQKKWTGAAYTYLDTEFNDITGYGNVDIAEFLRHDGDTDTRLQFQADQITLTAGGVDFINIVEDATDTVTISLGSDPYISITEGAGIVINEDSVDLDFRIESDNYTHALFVQGSDGYVGMNMTVPLAPLNVALTPTTAIGSGSHGAGTVGIFEHQGDTAEITILGDDFGGSQLNLGFITGGGALSASYVNLNTDTSDAFFNVNSTGIWAALSTGEFNINDTSDTTAQCNIRRDGEDSYQLALLNATDGTDVTFASSTNGFLLDAGGGADDINLNKGGAGDIYLAEGGGDVYLAVDGTGDVGIGISTGIVGNLHIADDNSSTVVTLERVDASVNENTVIARINARGGVDTQDTVGAIVIDSSENWDAASSGTRMEFRTTTNGSLSDSLKMTLGDDGMLEYAVPAWKDKNVGALTLSGPVGLQPGIVNYLDEAGADTGIATYGLAVGEGVSGQFEMQHDYLEGSDIIFHFHMEGITAPGGGTDKIQFQITYTMGQDGTTLNPVVVDTVEIDYDTQYEFVMVTFPTITGTDFNIGDQFLFTLERIAASADEYAGEALLGTIGIHYQVDTIGSRTATTK